MKLILCKQCSKMRKIFKSAVIVAVCLIFGCVAVSQVYMAVCRESVGVSSKEAEVLYDYVELMFQKYDGGEAFVLLDGEKYSDVSSGRMRIEITDTSVIELYNGTGKNIEVEITDSSPRTEVIAQSGHIVCRSGINYICRCLYAQ